MLLCGVDFVEIEDSNEEAKIVSNSHTQETNDDEEEMVR